MKNRSRLLSLALLTLLSVVSNSILTAATLPGLDSWDGLSESTVTTGNFLSATAISYTYPDGEIGWHRVGLASAHDGSSYWRDQYGVRLELYNPTEANLNITAAMLTAPTLKGKAPVVSKFISKTSLAGKGWHTVTFPIESFNYEKARPFVLEAIKTFEITASPADGSQAQLQIRNPHLIEADIISLKSPVRSKSAKGSDSVTYQLELTNCTDAPQAVTLSRIIRGREEVMATTLSPDSLTLAPGESQTCEVTVTMSERVPAGGRETQLIQAMANGRDAGQIEYITLSQMEHPYILHNKERWDDVREKAKTVEWAKALGDVYDKLV
ncbi:MAG: hypothetical protein NWR36_00430, partial [Opitutales bacterium]|nr:hypothetical protein [Opitutales bacterium]